jgi:hypothetical protein
MGRISLKAATRGGFFCPLLFGRIVEVSRQGGRLNRALLRQFL